ncbi:hypothetical protein [Streptomyces colonosanans]|nr:hypothetical protein [Streptomyces colonosanans]
MCDTDAITGIPTTPGTSRFTITAHDGDLASDAAISYHLGVSPA